MFNVSQINRFAWFSYSFLVFASGALLVSVLVCANLKSTTLPYVYGAMLGLFFMLTPLLGIAKAKLGSLNSGSIVYRRFKNIQNGFTAFSKWRTN